MTGRKKKITGLAAGLGILMTVQGIAAYQSAFDTAENVICAGTNTTEIGEEFPSPTPVAPDKNTDITKKIWVTNREQGAAGTSVDCYVRVSLAYSNSDIGRAVTMKGQNTTDWVYSDDGFYYYKNVLKEGESTRPLCTGFTVEADKIEKTYWEELENFQIQVYEESVEAKPYESYQSAWEAYEKQS